MRRISAPSATVKLARGDNEVAISQRGSGVIDALYGAIMKAIDEPIELIDYRINSLSRGKGSLGKVTAQIRCGDQLFSGKAIEQDVMRASALALINAVNKMVLK